MKINKICTYCKSVQVKKKEALNRKVCPKGVSKLLTGSSFKSLFIGPFFHLKKTIKIGLCLLDQVETSVCIKCQFE